MTRERTSTPILSRFTDETTADELTDLVDRFVSGRSEGKRTTRIYLKNDADKERDPDITVVVQEEGFDEAFSIEVRRGRNPIIRFGQGFNHITMTYVLDYAYGNEHKIDPRGLSAVYGEHKATELAELASQQRYIRAA